MVNTICWIALCTFPCLFFMFLLYDLHRSFARNKVHKHVMYSAHDVNTYTRFFVYIDDIRKIKGVKHYDIKVIDANTLRYLDNTVIIFNNGVFSNNIRIEDVIISNTDFDTAYNMLSVGNDIESREYELKKMLASCILASKGIYKPTEKEFSEVFDELVYQVNSIKDYISKDGTIKKNSMKNNSIKEK